MNLSSELLDRLNAILPRDADRFRISIRDNGRIVRSLETSDPAADLIRLPTQPPNAECRVEVAGAGDFEALVPYFRLLPLVAADPIVLVGPEDPNGFPVRLMIYDEAEGQYRVDFARFGTEFVVDAATLSMSHLLRTRFYRWVSEENEWRPVGHSRLLPGAGKLGRPEVTAGHLERAEFLVRRIRDLLPDMLGAGGDLIEFFDDTSFLADISPEASDTELRQILAVIVAGSSELTLRVRTVAYSSDDRKEPGPLVQVVDLTSAFDGLRNLLRGATKYEPAARRLLELTARDDGPLLRSLISGQLFKFLPEGIGVAPQEWKLDAVDILCADWDRLPEPSVLIGEFLNYIWLYALLQREAAGRGQTFDGFFDRAHLVECVDPVLSQMEAMPPGRTGFYSTRIFRAKLESLRDRERAAAMFADALSGESDMKLAATFDGGAETYFSLEQIREVWPAIAERRRDLLKTITVLSHPEADRSEPLFLFSTDLRFLAIYLPNWLAQAEYCKARGVDFHFVVIGDPEAVGKALVRAESLRVALADLRGADPATYANNVTYSTWTVPPWCGDPVTFYACARYIALGELTLRLRRNILIQDMDFTMVEDPKAFLTNFPQPGFGIQPSFGLYGIDAWRRFMGGTFYAPNSDEARESLKALEAYLIEGLVVGRSWYLDQNALSFFFEQTSDAGGALWPLRMARPTQQPKVNQLFEALQP